MQQPETYEMYPWEAVTLLMWQLCLDPYLHIWKPGVLKF